ncbi:MAG TPA: hypothetical protein VII71_05870 [Verrucomicrobiae bacterium]
MQYGKHPINRRSRRRLHLATGALSLAMWLFIAFAEIHPSLHAWLHGGAIPLNDDDCAIVAIAHGKVDSVTCEVPGVVPITPVEITPRVEFSVFNRTVQNLRSGRAPPALPAVS